jgi:hypothetical protein
MTLRNADGRRGPAGVGDFLDALVRVGGGGTVPDPEVVTRLIGGTRGTDALAAPGS